MSTRWYSLLPINLFIKVRLNSFPVRPMLSSTFVPGSLCALLRKASGGNRKVLFSVCLGENFHLMALV